MAIFSQYNLILYPLKDKNGVEKIYNFVDILTRVKLDMTQEQILAITSPYEISDGETPEYISTKIYGVQDYYWTILFVNELYDYLGDWFKSEEQLKEFVISTYGESQIDTPRYVIDKYGIVRRNPDPTLTDFQNSFTNVKYTGEMNIASNYAWESILNESVRNIRIIKPSRIAEFVKLFNLQLSK